MATTRSSLTRLALVGVLVAGGIGTYLATRPDDPTPIAAATIFKTATVEAGSLATSEKIDGSVVLSDVTTVLHRIEGQVSSSTNSASNSTPANGAPSANGVVSASATNVAAALSLRAGPSSPQRHSATRSRSATTGSATAADDHIRRRPSQMAATTATTTADRSRSPHQSHTGHDTGRHRSRRRSTHHRCPPPRCTTTAQGAGGGGGIQPAELAAPPAARPCRR